MKSDLIRLCEVSIVSKWNLTYRATQHGLGFNNFHSKCADQMNCLTIVKSESGNVFGGYIDGAWSKEGHYKKDSNAYLFSLINKDNNILKIRCSRENAAGGAKHTFIQMYGADDLMLYADSNVNTDSLSNLGICYRHPNYAFGSTQVQEFSGSKFFKTIEIEMYCKQPLN